MSVIKKRIRANVIIITMVMMLAITGISISVYKSSNSEIITSATSKEVSDLQAKANAAVVFAITNLKLTADNATSPHPTCNSAATCNVSAVAGDNYRIPFIWTSLPSANFTTAPLSTWQTYGYKIPGSANDYVIVGLNPSSETCPMGRSYTIYGYANVNGKFAFAQGTHNWQAYNCNSLDVSSSANVTPTIAKYAYWWNNNTSSSVRATGGTVTVGGVSIDIGLPEDTSLSDHKAWINYSGNCCCDHYCRWVNVSGSNVYKCTNGNGVEVTPTAGNSYPRCNTYGRYTNNAALNASSNANGTFTIPSNYLTRCSAAGYTQPPQLGYSYSTLKYVDANNTGCLSHLCGFYSDNSWYNYRGDYENYRAGFTGNCGNSACSYMYNERRLGTTRNYYCSSRLNNTNSTTQHNFASSNRPQGNSFGSTSALQSGTISTPSSETFYGGWSANSYWWDCSTGGNYAYNRRQHLYSATDCANGGSSPCVNSCGYTWSWNGTSRGNAYCSNTCCANCWGGWSWNGDAYNGSYKICLNSSCQSC